MYQIAYSLANIFTKVRKVLAHENLTFVIWHEWDLRMIYASELFQILFSNNGVYFGHCGCHFWKHHNKTMAQKLDNLFQLQLLDLFFPKYSIYFICVWNGLYKYAWVFLKFVLDILSIKMFDDQKYWLCWINMSLHWFLYFEENFHF